MLGCTERSIYFTRKGVSVVLVPRRILLHNCTMPKKTRTYATQVYTVPNVVLKFERNSGAIYDSFAVPLVPLITRRLGTASTIVDQTGNDGRFRPVTHTSERYDAVPVGSLQNYQQSLWVQGKFANSFKRCHAWNVLPGVHSRRYITFTAGVASISNSLSAVPWNDLAISALQATLPSFHTQNSLVNFLLELKDFKSVVKLIGSRFGQKLDRIRNFRVKLPDGSYRSVMSSIPKDKPLAWLSKRYLEYNFGWRPLYRDVVSLLKEVTGFYALYQELVENADKPVQKHWRTHVSGTAVGESRLSFNDAGETVTTSYEGSWAYKAKYQVVAEATPGILYNATVRLRYAIPPELLAAGGLAKAWLDLLGVSRNPAILWNAIPFSFIVDWIVSIGAKLDRLRLDNIEFKTEILDFCHSAKFKRRVTYDLAVFNQDAAGVYYSLPYVTTDSCVIERYERKTGYPSISLALQTSGLSVREFSLAGALFNAKRGH